VGQPFLQILAEIKEIWFWRLFSVPLGAAAAGQSMEAAPIVVPPPHPNVKAIREFQLCRIFSANQIDHVAKTFASP
jgi:hypothetical protein